MPDAWIDPLKLLAPDLPASWLARPALPRGAALPPATLVVAGPGYGKTLALAAMLRDTSPETLRAWCTFDEADGDWVDAMHHMVAALRDQVPGFGPDVAALLAAEQAEPRAVWRRYVAALAALGVPVAVALDESHHLAPALLTAILADVGRVPPGLHLLLATRTPPAAPLARARAQGQLVLVGVDELRFTPAEVEAYLLARAPGSHVPAGWAAAAAPLEGWPLGLAALVATGTGHAVASLVADMIAAQPAERQAFLLRAARLTTLTAQACRQVLEVPDAAPMLAALEADGLVQRLTGGAAFRLATVVRERLVEEGEQGLAPDERRALHRRAAAYYGAQGQDEVALGHWLAAQAWAEALALGEACFPAMRYGGRAAAIGRALAAIPAEVGEAQPTWLMWQGHLAARAGRRADAQACYARVRALCLACGDGAGAFQALVRLANAALIGQDPEAYAACWEEARGFAHAAAAEDVADMHLVRAHAAEQAGDLAAMRAENEAVVALPVGDRIELAASQVIALINLFTLAMHQGALTAALTRIERAIAMADERGFYPYAQHARFMRALAQLVRGDAAAAGTFLGALPADWGEPLDWYGRAAGWSVLGAWHGHAGRHREAEEALARALAEYEGAGLRDGLKVPLEHLAWLAIARGEPRRVAPLLAEVLGTDDEARRPVTAHDVALSLPLARAAHLAGAPAEALAILAAAAPAMAQLGTRRHAVRAQLLEAAARSALGEVALATQLLAAAREAALAGDMEYLLAQDQRLWAELGALTGPAVRVPGTGAGVSPPTPAAAGATAATAGAADLEVRCFGPCEARRGGVAIDQWPRRKAKLVLAALALNPAGLTPPELAEAIGGVESASTLKMAVSALRRSLEPELAQGERSRYVPLDGERYRLAPEALAYVDVAAFEARWREAHRLEAVDPAAAAERYTQALAHHRGDLLAETIFAGPFEGERMRLRGRAVAALSFVARRHAAASAFDAAEAAFARALALDPLEEALVVGLMAVCVERGQPQRAREAYWDARRALKQRIDARPGEALEAAFRALG